MQPHPLTNFDIQINFQNEPAVKQVQWRLNCAYSRNIWPKIKDRAYVKNLDEYRQIGTHWIALKSNTFQNKLICYFAIRISWQFFIEFKSMINVKVILYFFLDEIRCKNAWNTYS